MDGQAGRRAGGQGLGHSAWMLDACRTAMDGLNGLRLRDEGTLEEVPTVAGSAVLGPFVRYAALLLLNATRSPVRPRTALRPRPTHTRTPHAPALAPPPAPRCKHKSQSVRTFAVADSCRCRQLPLQTVAVADSCRCRQLPLQTVAVADCCSCSMLPLQTVAFAICCSCSLETPGRSWETRGLGQAGSRPS
jgi:hypothetical protein